MIDGQAESESLAVKTVKGSVYSIAASGVTLVLGFGRSVLMARLLSPEHFGIVALALTFLSFSAPIRNFGLDAALIHRKKDADFADSLAVHFTLRLILMGVFILVLLLATPLLRRVYPQKSLLVPILFGLTLGEIATALSATPTVYLRKEMNFKPLAVLQILTSLTMTIVGPVMAWRGWGVWAIVGEQVSGVVLSAVAVWVFLRPAQLRWSLRRDLVKWYWDYGKFVFVNQSLLPIVEQFDEFWIGTTLGNIPLGLYSKAYEFAHYPHKMVATPITKVALPAFSQVQSDRLTLSKTYYRFSSLFVRLGFMVVGIAAATVYEFIILILGAKWAPMASTFQIMTMYMLLYSIFKLSGNLMTAIGRPDINTYTLIIQAVFAIPLVIIASRELEINGVAMVTNFTLAVGLVYMLYQTRRVVDFSFRKMTLVPFVAFIAGYGLARLGGLLAHTHAGRAIFKIVIYAIVYNSVLWLYERETYVKYIRTVSGILWRNAKKQTGALSEKTTSA